MKILTFLVLVVLSSVLAGLYGALHDQLTYSISPEFFTDYRFQIFNIDPAMDDRLGAAIVGFKNTWKVGAVLGGILALVGMLHPTFEEMYKYTLQSFLITLAAAFMATLLGIAFIRSVDIPADQMEIMSGSIDNPAKFSKVVMVNNFGYVGAIIGMFMGIGWQVYQTKKYKS